MKQNSRDMTKGSPAGLLLAFALPVFVSLLFQQIYNVADTAIVSKTLGADALAAVGSIGSVNYLIIGFCNGMGMGFAIPVSQRFGAGDIKGMKKYAGNAVILYLITAAVFTVISCLLCMRILMWTKTPADIIQMSYDYLIIIFLGIPFQFAYNTLEAMIRSTGDSRSPLYILVTASCLNIVLDLLFILVFGMGVRGAALATILSQLFSAAGCIFLIVRRVPELHISRKDLIMEKAYVSGLLKNGFPMAMQMSVTGIGSIILQTSVNVLGSAAVAAVTAAERIGNLAAVPMSSLASAMSVYCGQNLGAEKYDRIASGTRTGILTGLLFSAAASAVLIIFGRSLTLLFLDADSAELIEMTYQYLRTAACFLWGQSLIFTVRFSVQGLGYGGIALAACLLEMVARSAFGLWFIPHYGYAAAGFSSPAAWIMANLLLVPSLIVIVRKLQEKEA